MLVVRPKGSSGNQVDASDLPATYQAIVDHLTPSLERQLDGYFDHQAAQGEPRNRGWVVLLAELKAEADDVFDADAERELLARILGAYYSAVLAGVHEVVRATFVDVPGLRS